MNKITCTRCGTSLAENIWYRTNSPFFPSGFLPYCPSCISKLYTPTLEGMDALCRWANWPFYANKFVLLLKGNADAETLLSIYYKTNIAVMFKEGYTSKIDWSSVATELEQLNSEGKLIDTLNPEKQKQHEQELRMFWEVDPEVPQYSISQLEKLQKLYEDLGRTQNATGLQEDQAKKVCSLSLDMDIARRNGELELYAKLMNAYTSLIKVAEFTPKTSQSSSSFESVGELVAFLEKTGFINKFYDGEQRDIVDKTIKSQQIFLRRIVSGESNLAEKIEQRLQRMNLLDRMEDGTTSEEEWSYDLHQDDDWLDAEQDTDYTDPDEEEEFDAGDEE